MTFALLGLSNPLLRAITEQGYDIPSPVQRDAIPVILDGRDVMAAAQTGTGKTAGFTLPLLQRLAAGDKAQANCIRALILTPTRELAAQVQESVATYSKYLTLRSTVVYGGVKINPQMQKLRAGVDVLVATPGRLLDLYNQNAIKFSQLEILVLDEADRMLDMGFARDINKILALLPKQRQNMLFSATFSDDIRSMSANILRKPVQIEVSPRNAAAKTVKQMVFEVDKSRKSALLSFLIGHNNWQQVLVFTRTKHGANRLTQKLEKDGIKAAAIHGNKSQGARTRALAQFKAGHIRVLVATDIAARGIDIDLLPHVINFELPNVPEDYVHRIGRTGRAGSEGEAISLVSADEAPLLRDIETLIQQRLTRETEIGFEPKQPVPLTEPRQVNPNKPKRPKKSSRRHGETQDKNARTQAPSKKRTSPKKKRPIISKNSATSSPHATPSRARTSKPRRPTR